MKVLVTGGTSLIGSQIAERLRDRDDEVILFQRHPGGGEFEQRLGDIADPEAVTTAMAGVDAVVHAAARVGIVGDWQEFERTNILGTANVVAAAVAAGVGRMVHVSSPSVANSGKSIVGGAANRPQGRGT